MPTALITGAGRGIGRACAFALAESGHDVAIVARGADQLDDVAGQVRERGVRALALPADLADAGEPARCATAAVDALGPVSVLVNSAGANGPFGRLWTTDPDEFDRVLRVNLLACHRLAVALLPAMVQAGYGRIVNVSSGAARHPLGGTGAYSTSKAALEMLTRQLAAELTGTGVAAVIVDPGAVDTGMQREVRSQSADTLGVTQHAFIQQITDPTGLRPTEEPARLIAALAGVAGADFNGATVEVGSADAERLTADVT